MRYNPDTGMFDQSYAAAWQLGQLLALNSKQFSVGLYNWKRTNQLNTVQQAEQQALQSALSGTISQTSGDGEATQDNWVKKGVFDKLKSRGNQLFSQSSPQSSQSSATTKLTTSSLSSLKLSETMTDSGKITALDSTPPQLPDYLNTWLGKLVLLSGVPFNYLVPDERMLPVESIRFFQLDMNWINCLIDGANSIGRSTAADAAHDTASAIAIRNQATARARQIRANWLNQEVSTSTQTQPISGFLLRSAVVSDYPGLVINAFAAENSGTPLTMLRLEKLSPNVLIGLFEGVIQQVIIHPAPEGLHFGVNYPDSDIQSFTKSLRYIQASGSNQPGEEINGVLFNVPFRTGSYQAIQVDNLANSLQTNLISNQGTTSGAAYTAAEFALEMIEGVQEVAFVNQ